MLSVQEIKTFIDNDLASTKKQLAKVGMDYYEARHDIQYYKIFYFDAKGNLKEDETKSNIRISHPYFTELVDQGVQYALSGKDGFVRSDDPELQAHLDEYFNENEEFTAELYDILTGAVAKGFEYAYAYKNVDGRLSFQCADSLGIIEVRETETDDHCEYIIYWYVDSIGKNNQAIKRIEVWDKEQVWYYCQIDDGEITLDDNKKHNPSPHILYSKGNDKGEKLFYDNFGFIPFFRIDNNKKQQSGLVPIKDIIDDYDLMNAGLTNNIQDTNEALYVVRGFQGDNMDELMQNIKAKKHVGVDEDGGVDIKTIDIPVAARQAKMEIDEKNIYRFGFGLNISGLKDTAATTSIAIKSAYALLDLKTNKLEIRLKQFMRKLLKPVLAEINKANGTGYEQKDVYFRFDRELPVNEQEHAQIELTDAQRKQTEINTLLNLVPHLGNEIALEQIFDQLDLDYEDYKDRLPSQNEPDPYKAQTALDNAPVASEPTGGGVIE